MSGAMSNSSFDIEKTASIGTAQQTCATVPAFYMGAGDPT